MQYIKIFTLCFLFFVYSAPQALAVSEPTLSALQNQEPTENIPIITMRKGEHLNYSRIVFDFTNSVVYQATVEGNKLKIVFDIAFIPDFGALVTQPLRWISNPQLPQSEGLMSLEFDVEENSEMINFYLGTKVVIDVYDPTAAKGAVETDNIVRIRDGAVIKDSETPVPAFDPEVTDYTISAAYTEIDNGALITFTTKIPTAAAVFERAGILWVVLETRAPIDNRSFNSLDRFLKERIRSLEVDLFESATILRYAIKPSQSIGVDRDGLDWKISLKDTANAPRNPLIPVEQETDDDQFRIFVPAEDVGTRLELVDPIVGDNLTIVPLRSSSRGMPARYDYTNFILPVTAQGLVVQRISDQLAVYRYRNGIAVGGIDSSLASLPGGVGGDATKDFDPLVDFKSWMQGDASDFNRVESNLLYRLASSANDNRNGARWPLARFYLAHNRAADALGILEQMLDDDSQLPSQPKFRAARGIAQAMLTHYDEALFDFGMRELRSDQDIALWRGVIYQIQGEDEDAAAELERGSDAIGRYGAYERASFVLASARAYFEIGRIEKAEFELDQLAGHPLTLKQMQEEVLLRAEIALSREDGENAMLLLNYLAMSRNRSISSRARYARLKYEVEIGAITPADAVEEMERLRYVWRGGHFEMNLLKTLGEIYIEDNNYRDGLDSMRQIVSYFSKTDLATDTSNAMTSIFRDLYLNCKADVLQPFQALDLYYEYKELTPYGAEGDRLIRRMADRLVAVELFEPAIEFLDYQIKDRIKTGAARAQVAGNLAKVFMLDSKPNDAIEILRLTRTSNMPREIENTRNLIEARALYEVERYEEAEVLAAPIDNLEAHLILADIYWQTGDWSRVITVNTKILGDGWRTKEELDVSHRLLLLRLAIAYTNNQDQSSLAMLRGRYLEQILTGDFAASFDLLTNPDDLSSRDIATIISEIDDVNNVESYLKTYRESFADNDCEPLFENVYDQEQKVLGTEG